MSSLKETGHMVEVIPAADFLCVELLDVPVSIMICFGHMSDRNFSCICTRIIVHLN
jgi:hypothetical protein